MRRELKNLLSFFTKYERENRTLFGPGLEFYLFYIFLRRYDSIREDFLLPHFGYDLKKYISPSSDCLPYNDLINPFLDLLQEKNSSSFDLDDLPKLFKNKEAVNVLGNSEFKVLNKAITNSGISNFSLENYSIDEFDEFFLKLIEKTTQNEGKSSWSLLSQNFAKFISENIPSNSKSLYVGDETAEIIYNSNSNDEKIDIAANNNSLLWYYIRIILTGKWNIEVIFNELASFFQDHDFIFLNPAFGKISSKDRKDLSNHFGVDFNFRTWEGLYTKLALSPDRKKGKAFLLIPSRFLHANTKDYREIREFFVDSRSLQTIIRLPNNIFKGASSSVSFCLIEIDYAKKSNSVRFIDGLEIKTNTQNSTLILEQISDYWQGQIGFYSYTLDISINGIKNNKYSLAFTDYFNVSQDDQKHIRTQEEELISMAEILTRMRLKTHKEISNVPVLGISELSENLIEYEVDASKLPEPD